MSAERNTRPQKPPKGISTIPGIPAPPSPERHADSDVHPPRWLPVHETADRIEVHINELVLDGFEQRRLNSNLLDNTVRLELARLFRECGPPAGLWQGGDLSDLFDQEIDLSFHDDTHTIAIHIARAVYRGLENR